MKFSLRHVFGVSKWSILFSAISIGFGCADPHFLDKTKKDSSIIQGKSVTKDSPLANRVVFIGHNFDSTNRTPEYFGLCTGVVLHPRIILTAAHCAANYKTSKVITTLNAKKTQLATESIYSIVDATIHKNYFFTKTAKTNLNYDLALLKLDRPLNIEPSKLLFSPIQEHEVVQDSQVISAEPVGLVLGYGRTTALLEPTQNTQNLQQLNGELNFTFLNLKSVDLNAALFSVPQHDKPGVCSGDSGGPMYVLENGVYKLKALAISVFKKPEENASVDQIYNACNYNSLFLNLDHQQEWIRSEMQMLLK